ncbi:hypothetical protein NPIL_217671, partial [Nephila pilipes]
LIISLSRASTVLIISLTMRHLPVSKRERLIRANGSHNDTADRILEGVSNVTENAFLFLQTEEERRTTTKSALSLQFVAHRLKSVSRD